MSRGETPKVILDFIAITLIAMTGLVLLFGGLGGLIGQDQASVNLSFFMLAMLGLALSLMLVSGVVSLTPSIGKSAFTQQITYIMASLAGFFILNIIVPPAVPYQLSLASSNRFVAVLISVPEELLFRGWATPFLVKRMGLLGGVMAQAGLFMLYHLFVLGTDLAGLLIVFGAGAIAGFGLMKTRRLSIPMASHLLNNFIAVGI